MKKGIYYLQVELIKFTFLIYFPVPHWFTKPSDTGFIKMIFFCKSNNLLFTTQRKHSRLNY